MLSDCVAGEGGDYSYPTPALLDTVAVVNGERLASVDVFPDLDETGRPQDGEIETKVVCCIRQSTRSILVDVSAELHELVVEVRSFQLYIGLQTRNSNGCDVPCLLLQQEDCCCASLPLVSVRRGNENKDSMLQRMLDELLV